MLYQHILFYMMKKETILIAIVLCLTLGLAPFTPEPHIAGKLRWVAGGAEGMKMMDYLDLILHGAPWLLLLIIIFKSIMLKVKN